MTTPHTHGDGSVCTASHDHSDYERDYDLYSAARRYCDWAKLDSAAAHEFASWVLDTYRDDTMSLNFNVAWNEWLGI